jgi:hypothetical protein
MEPAGHFPSLIASAVEANKTLLWFAAAVLLGNGIAAVVAVLVNWPAQFGQVGTDAGQSF